jgi:hypothetical protein
LRGGAAGRCAFFNDVFGGWAGGVGGGGNVFSKREAVNAQRSHGTRNRASRHQKLTQGPGRPFRKLAFGGGLCELFAVFWGGLAVRRKRDWWSVVQQHFAKIAFSQRVYFRGVQTR